MPAVRVAINGFGRIGRSAFKAAIEKHSQDIEIVGINDLTEPKILAHLLEYDTAYGRWSKQVSSDEHSIIIDGKHYPISAEKEPAKLPWKSLNVDVVIESTGRFTDEAGMKQHLDAGAKRVVLSAPAKGGNIGTFLIGVNHDKYHSENLINNASCTTNCIAPVAAIILEKFGIQKALMTTVHSVTAEQNLVDGPPPGGKANDLRRARAAYANMIPTTTGAAISVTEAIPELKGLFDGRAIRVPTIVGSISDFTFLLKKKTTVEEVNQAIKDACNMPRWKGIVAWTEEPLVSSDIIGRPESAIVDLGLTQVVDGDMVKLFAWYDNEWGYSNRLVEQVVNVGKQAVNSGPPSDGHSGGKQNETKPEPVKHETTPSTPLPAAPPKHLDHADIPTAPELTLPPSPPQPKQDDAANYHPFFSPQNMDSQEKPLFTPEKQTEWHDNAAQPPNSHPILPDHTPPTPAPASTVPKVMAALSDEPTAPAQNSQSSYGLTINPPTPTFSHTPVSTSAPVTSNPAPQSSPSGSDGTPPVKPQEPVIHDQVLPPAPEPQDHHSGFSLWPFGKKD